MANKNLIDKVGKYIDKYYEPAIDDIKIDKEMKSIFDKITNLERREPKRRILRKSR